jgi:apolipoprotein D and lipocalin family protein
MSRALLAAGLLLTVPACAGSATAEPLGPVGNFAVERYLGTWHEIASIAAWFQDQCVAATSATYTPAATPGQISVLNACDTAAGERARAIGQARFTGATSEGALEVTFLRLFDRPLWLTAGAYVVLALDDDYRWSAVGHPSRDYAWILAREPALDLATLAKIEGAYAAAGYDTCRLLTSPKGVGEQRQPLCELVAGAAEPRS